MIGAKEGAPWGPGEPLESWMVFIGRKLPQDLFSNAPALCVRGAGESLVERKEG